MSGAKPSAGGHPLHDAGTPAIRRPAAVLFDLDGTLADTAQDLCAPANRMLEQRGLAAIPVADLGRFASSGARGLLGRAFDIKPGDADYEALRDEFLRGYEQGLCVHTALFPGMEAVLARLELEGIPWGVVSNKTEVYVRPILDQMKLGARSACAIGGDTADRAKPHPDPLLLAARRLGVDPERCVYVGDDFRDIVAGHAAGMLTVAAAYGYLGTESKPHEWEAHFVIERAEALIGLIRFD